MREIERNFIPKNTFKKIRFWLAKLAGQPVLKFRGIGNELTQFSIFLGLMFFWGQGVLLFILKISRNMTT